MGAFKAKIARHSTAMAQIFNAEIIHFTCSLVDDALFSVCLEYSAAYAQDMFHGVDGHLAGGQQPSAIACWY